jgi:CheY-like chemotaxis protein
MTSILLVDDGPDIIMLCKNLLEKAGYEVVVA